MTAEDKLKLIMEYKKNTGIEIGKPSIKFNKEEEKDTKCTKLEKVVKTVEKPTRSFTPTFEPSDDIIDDDIFTPLSFSYKMKEEEKDKVDLYERIKNMILNIDCTNGYDNALTQFDEVLLNLSEYNSGFLTTSQILILVSTMIVKLEELSKIDYPEMSLEEAIVKIEQDSDKLVHNGGSINKYFFSDFFMNYSEIEKKNFDMIKGKYKSEVKNIAAQIYKKGEMLGILLKWLIT